MKYNEKKITVNLKQGEITFTSTKINSLKLFFSQPIQTHLFDNEIRIYIYIFIKHLKQINRRGADMTCK